jgi:hypothetical protein
MQTLAHPVGSPKSIYAGVIEPVTAGSALLAVREQLSELTCALGERDTVALERQIGALRQALVNLRPALEKSSALAASADMRLQLNLMRAEVSAQRETLARASAAVARHLAVVLPHQQSALYSQRGDTALAVSPASQKA